MIAILRRASIALGCMIAVSAPAQPATVLTFGPSDGVLSFTLPGSRAGFQYTVTVEGGDFDRALYPEVSMSREIRFLFYGDDGRLRGNERTETAFCFVDGCRSPTTNYAQLRGTSRNLTVRTRRGFDNCTPQTPPLIQCGINPNFDLGSLIYYGEFLENSSIATVTISDPTAIPEPATWLMLVSGFGISGWMLRRHRSAPDLQAA